MPEHLRALVVVLVFGVGCFYVARGAIAPSLLPLDTFKRWRLWWLGCTLVLFLSHAAWLYLLIVAVALLAYRRREAHVMGLYFVLLFAAPPTPMQLPGLGIIDHLWELDHSRLLALCLLLPAALSLMQRATTPRWGSSPVDWMVLGYLVLLSLLAFREGNVTSGFRTVFSRWVDIFLPYYVASRSIRNEEGFRHALTGFLLAAMILSLIGIFEMLRSWKLYSAVTVVLGLGDSFFGMYLMRSGFLRPNATVGHSIVLGYLLVVALGFYLYLKEFLTKPRYRWMGMALLVAGILASLSRGPWVGAAFLVVVYLGVGPRPIKDLGRLGLLAVVGFVILSVVPGGQFLIDMLPIVGNVEQGNVEYRADLLTSALPVIGRNLLTGSYDFLQAPELQVMMQGQGIIDVVNTYVGVALYSGLLGLGLFVGAFLFALRDLRSGMRIGRRHSAEAARLGRALFATVASIMLIIYTVSSISSIPVVYWSVLGLSVAYAVLMKERSGEAVNSPAPVVVA